MPLKIDRLALSVSEAAEAIGVCRAQGYKMVASGELPSIDVGRRKLVPVVALRQFVEDRTESNPRDEAAR